MIPGSNHRELKMPMIFFQQGISKKICNKKETGLMRYQREALRHITNNIVYTSLRRRIMPGLVVDVRERMQRKRSIVGRAREKK